MHTPTALVLCQQPRPRRSTTTLPRPLLEQYNHGRVGAARPLKCYHTSEISVKVKIISVGVLN